VNNEALMVAGVVVIMIVVVIGERLRFFNSRSSDMGDLSQFPFLARIKARVKGASTVFLVSILALTGFLIPTAWLWMHNKPFSGTPLELLIGICVFALWGSTGIVVVARKELPQLITVRGTLAVIYGVLIVVFCWGAAFLTLIVLLQDLLGT
jgi:hypothetical protein